MVRVKNIIALITIIASLFIMPAPAEASGETVMIEGSVAGQAKNLRKAVTFVDKYTTTHFVYGECRHGLRCIILERNPHRPRATAYSSWRGSKRGHVTISINPGRTNAYMIRLWAHELGHAMFLPHSKYATNLMWPKLRKNNGDNVPMRFTAAQRKTLRKH